MIVDDSDFMRITIAPPEYNSPLIVYADRVEISQITFQLFKPV